MAALGALIELIVIAISALFGREWDIHALIAGALLAIVGTQVVALGICAHAYGTYFMGDEDRWFDRMRARYRLEHGLMLGGAVIFGGVVIGTGIVIDWISHGFGALDEDNLAVLAATLIIIGDPDLLLVVPALDPRSAPAALGESAAGCQRAANRGHGRRSATLRAAMRICLVYDCLFPHTVGGAERWYRSLSERLAAEGHDVTYLTLRQWDRGADPGVPGVACGRRRPSDEAVHGLRVRAGSLPPLVFGAGVLWHLLRYGRRYDVVHTCSFPYFSMLAAAAARRRGRYRLVVDWFEVWTRGYWREYLGRRSGRPRVAHPAAVRARATARVLLLTPVRRAAASRGSARRDHDARRDLRRTAGSRACRAPAEPVVVFAGRHIPEKRVPAIVPAIARARRQRAAASRRDPR